MKCPVECCRCYNGSGTKRVGTPKGLSAESALIAQESGLRECRLYENYRREVEIVGEGGSKVVVGGAGQSVKLRVCCALCLLCNKDKETRRWRGRRELSAN